MSELEVLAGGEVGGWDIVDLGGLVVGWLEGGGSGWMVDVEGKRNLDGWFRGMGLEA